MIFQDKEVVRLSPVHAQVDKEVKEAKEVLPHHLLDQQFPAAQMTSAVKSSVPMASASTTSASATVPQTRDVLVGIMIPATRTTADA